MSDKLQSVARSPHMAQPTTPDEPKFAGHLPGGNLENETQQKYKMVEHSTGSLRTHASRPNIEAELLRPLKQAKQHARSVNN